MSKVMVAIDNSAAARPVLAVAEAVAALLGVELEAVHVREDAGATARAAAEAAGIPLRVVTGSIIGGLVKACENEDVRVLVAGLRGTPAGPRPAGSVALALIVALGKPVVVVPPQARVPYTLERILVPLDGTAETAEALRDVLDLVSEAPADVVALHVLEHHALPLFSDQPQHEADTWRREFLIRHGPQLERRHLEVRIGSPAEHLLPVADKMEADLIALAWAQDLAAGRAAVIREALGRSDIPVLLVPVSS
jgi:nucleotide-binding universal stress UspA family protein